MPSAQARRRPSSSHAPGEEFLSDGRQTSTQVVDTALAALDKSSPTVVSGLRNKLLATGYRATPRKLMLTVSERLLKSN